MRLFTRFLEVLCKWMTAGRSNLAVAALLLTGLVHAATPPSQASQAMVDALTRANAAVVGVQVTVPDDARSADTLGKQRSGSGVVIGQDGLILTIGYLLLEAESIQITTPDNKTLPARAVGYDLATGFGLLRPLLPMRLAPVPLGTSSGLETGEALMASSGVQADGDAADVSLTRVVSKRAFSGYWEYHIDLAIFTSPPISNHSGAPLFNQKGELLGIGSLFTLDALGSNRRFPGNMFVPVDLLKPILSELQQTGTTRPSRRPWLGLTSSEQGGRVQIVRVAKDSPAQSAGLRPGDVVLAVDDAKVSTLETFYKKLWDHAEPDAPIRLTVLQGSDIKTITLKGVDRMSTMKKPDGI